MRKKLPKCSLMHFEIRDVSIMREPIDAQNQRRKEDLDNEDSRESKGRTEDRPETQTNAQGKEELDKG